MTFVCVCGFISFAAIKEKDKDKNKIKMKMKALSGKKPESR